MGRFLGVDVLAGDYPAWSSYHYVLGNPNNFVDPTGASSDEYNVYLTKNKDTGEYNYSSPEKIGEEGDNDIDYINIIEITSDEEGNESYSKVGEVSYNNPSAGHDIKSDTDGAGEWSIKGGRALSEGLGPIEYLNPTRGASKIGIKAFAAYGSKGGGGELEGWIAKTLYSKMRKDSPEALTHFEKALKKGFVGGKKESGMVKLSGKGKKVSGKTYQYELKTNLNSKFGDHRLYGNKGPWPRTVRGKTLTTNKVIFRDYKKKH